MRTGNAGGDKRSTHVMHGQSMTQLASVELRRAVASRVLHRPSVAGPAGRNARYPHRLSPSSEFNRIDGKRSL